MTRQAALRSLRGPVLLLALAAVASGAAPATAGTTSPLVSQATTAHDTDRDELWAQRSWLPAPPGPGHGAPENQPLLTNPASPWVLVTRTIPLDPAGYEPDDLAPLTGTGVLARSDMAAPFAELVAAAAEDGVTVRAVSAYRPVQAQEALWSAYVAQYGLERAQRFSARPGHSEHQTGWAVDVDDATGVCSVRACFNDTEAARWLAEHAHEHGFVVRYPDGAESVTGYQHEGWHLRYLGTTVAGEMHDRGIPTYEDYVTAPLPGLAHGPTPWLIEPTTAVWAPLSPP